MPGDSLDLQRLITAWPTPHYRVFLLALNGSILRERPIQARDDDEAIGHAREMMDGRSLDLWDGLRFIEHFPAISSDT